MSLDVAEPVYESSEMEPEYQPYRAMNSLGIVSLAIGLVSIYFAALAWTLAMIPILGIIIGVRGIWSIKKHPDEYVGMPIAVAGVVLCVLTWVGGWSWLTYDYMTEVPPGYARLTYSQLQPDVKTAPGTLQIPQSAMDFNGKRVFVKGYVYPGATTSNIKTFVLCRDNGDCCFGGKPKLTDMILVELVDPLRLRYSPNLQKLAGTFRVKPGQATENLGGVLYQLEADYLK